MPQPARERFLFLLRTSVHDGCFTRLTLGKHRGADATLQKLLVRPVSLKTGPHFSFVWRHTTRDITKNFPPDEALAQIDALLGTDFLDAYLFTTLWDAQFQSRPDGSARTHLTASPTLAVTAPSAHDRAKSYLIPADSRWLQALGVTNAHGQPREHMADKFRQIQKFAELLTHLLTEAFPGSQPSDSSHVTSHKSLRIVDAGSGKGYLTFALAALLGDRAAIRGIEARPELVALCNRVARENHLAHLTFTAGTIADTPLDSLDVLIALHACDTATDDALAQGIAAGARLLVVAPCCQKELRPQLTAPPVLADALQHGIFQERQAEFVTDALRAQLLEWAGYRTKVFEFISTEHTAKNVMIAAIKAHAPADPARAARLRDFAAFYGIRHQQLAAHLGFNLQA